MFVVVTTHGRSFYYKICRAETSFLILDPAMKWSTKEMGTLPEGTSFDPVTEFKLIQCFPCSFCSSQVLCMVSINVQFHLSFSHGTKPWWPKNKFRMFVSRHMFRFILHKGSTITSWPFQIQYQFQLALAISGKNT